MEEEWGMSGNDLKEIPGAEGYFLSLEEGAVYSNKKGFLVKHTGQLSTGGIRKFTLTISGKRRSMSYWKIVSLVFPKTPPKGLVEIPEYPGYFLNKSGELYSNKITFNNSYGDFKRCGSVNVEGYPCHNFWVNGKCRKHFIHHLVAKMFIGPRPKGPSGDHVRHLNGNKLDNRVENLAYGSWEDNANDNLLLGKPAVCSGDSHKDAKLTCALVREARVRRTYGESVVSIAKELGVDGSTMSRAIRGVTWRTV